MTRPEIIAKLEAATGPDRELGRAVLLLAGWRRTCVWHSYGPLYQWSAPHGRASYEEGGEPDPTRSIDAAVMLVPAGLFWHVGHGKTRADEPLGGASIIAPGSLEVIAEAEAATAPLALSSAAIRAGEREDD